MGASHALLVAEPVEAVVEIPLIPAVDRAGTGDRF